MLVVMVMPVVLALLAPVVPAGLVNETVTFLPRVFLLVELARVGPLLVVLHVCPVLLLPYRLLMSILRPSTTLCRV